MTGMAIKISDLSKCYRIGEYTGVTMLREAITQSFSRGFNRKQSDKEIFWALKNVSFDVPHGEVVGIIGRNGAGKSTLLKLLSKITYPTSGQTEVNGKIATLLEVGTGFHEELTGRENIYLNGSILGLKKKEIIERLGGIVEFSGVEQFIDTPIKRYSSGMRLRLGFAVAAHLSPDILLVDEVLAVGDSEFQKKCLNAMDDLRNTGRTILFVSHNMAAIENLCTRCIWIEGGKIKDDGNAREVVANYMKTFSQNFSGYINFDNIQSRSGNGYAKFTGFQILNDNGETHNYIRSGDKITLRLNFSASKRLSDLHLGLEIHNEFGTLVAASNNWATGNDISSVKPGKCHADFEIDCLYLLPGRYFISLWLGRWDNLHDRLNSCVSIDIEPSDFYGSGRGIEGRFGLTFFPSRWKFCQHP